MALDSGDLLRRLPRLARREQEISALDLEQRHSLGNRLGKVVRRFAEEEQLLVRKALEQHANDFACQLSMLAF